MISSGYVSTKNCASIVGCIVIFFSSVVLLNPNGKFCVVPFSDRYDPQPRMLMFLKRKEKVSGCHRTASSSAVECRCNNIQYVGKNVSYRVILDIPDNELWRKIAFG